MKLKGLCLLFLLTLFSCKFSTKKPNSDCTKTHSIKLGSVLITLPLCYKVYRPDTVMHEWLFFILKDKQIKLEGNAGTALTSLDETIFIKNDKSITLYSDTTGTILKQIGYYKKGDGYGMIVNIINIKDKTTFIKNMLKGEKHINKDLANDQFFLKLSAGTNDDFYMSKKEIDNLSKEDVDILVSAFKKCKIIK